jgi:hypothetical protein
MIAHRLVNGKAVMGLRILVLTPVPENGSIAIKQIISPGFKAMPKAQR